MSEEFTTPDLIKLVGRQFEAADRRELAFVTSGFALDAVFEGRRVGAGRDHVRCGHPGWASGWPRRSPSTARDGCSSGLVLSFERERALFDLGLDE